MRAGLREIVDEFADRGIDLSTDPRLTEAILLDSFPESPAEIHALVDAIRSGAIQYMRDRAPQGAAFSIHGSAAHLSEWAGLREDLAQWTVEAWWDALALGRTGLSAPSRPADPTLVIVGPTSPDLPQSSVGPDLMPSPPLTPSPPAPDPVPIAPAEVPLAPAVGATLSGAEALPVPPENSRVPRRNIDPRPPEGGDQPPRSATPLSERLNQQPRSAPPPVERRAAPVSLGRRRGAVLVVGTVVLVVIAYLAIAGGAGLPPFKSTTSVTPTTSASLSQQLESVIPHPGNCAGLTADQIGSDASGASAAFQCTPDAGLSVVYAIFPSDAAASTDYAKDARPGTCPVGASYPDGLLHCYSMHGAQNDILWWPNNDNVVCLASSKSLSLSTILQDWKTLGPS